MAESKFSDRYAWNPRLRESGKLPAEPNFDEATLNFIDRNNANLSSKELIRAAKALKLVPLPEQ